MKTHVESVHEGKKPFKCDICGSYFAHKGTLKIHVDGVHKLISHICELCERSFKCKSGLNHHKNEFHNMGKLFHCPVCQKTFKRKFEMNAHIRIDHEGRKDFICSICTVSFGRKNGLEVHFKSVHEKALKCNICDKLFGLKHKLERHVASVHEDNKHC